MATAARALPRIGTIVNSRSARPHLRRRDHLITMLFAFWTLFGVFLDGWAHSELIETLESFFTPWHAVLYTGFTGAALWTGYQGMRFQRRGEAFDVARIPVGYGLALVGVVLFGTSGTGDMIWHSIFGIEQGIEALMSPTHLGLFLGVGLILTAPLRAAWHSPDDVSASFRTFFPTALSLALSTAGIAFFVMYMSPLKEQVARVDWTTWAALRGDEFAEMSQGFGVGGILVSTIVLLAPLLVALRRWSLPFGTATLIGTLVGTGMVAIEGFHNGEVALAYAVGGLATDALVMILDPRAENVARYRAFAAAVPLVVWSSYFAIVQLTGGIGWVVEFWAGSVVLASMTGFGLATVMSLPAAPSQPTGT
ncbi:MAG: hypothetical protein ACRDKT_14770 [Actinomycetota bacterium]